MRRGAALIGCLMSLALCGCAATLGDGEPSAATPSGATPPAARQAPAGSPYAAPANYRQLIARKLTEAGGPSPILEATISMPTERFVGIMNGFRPIVCATTTRDAWLLPTFTEWLFMFEGGQISAAV